MTIAQWLVPTMIELKDAGVDSPRRDCLVLLEDTINKDRAWVTAHPEYELDKKVVQQLSNLVNRRKNREPLAYIRGKAWFYGRFFEVNRTVLIPRPETENAIEIVKNLQPETIIDVGTGSGCIAITAKLELPNAKVYATDTSSGAIKMAQKNAQQLGADVTFLSGSLLNPLQNIDLSNSIIIANLPYVPNDLVTSPEITTEPAEALFSGTDGLNHYREFWLQIGSSLTRPKNILIESLENQHKQVATLANSAGYELAETDVLIQVFTDRQLQ